VFSAQIFQENTFLKTKLNFLLTGKCFPLTGKCFPLTNFPNGKQTQESLESGFPKNKFQETNMALEKTRAENTCSCLANFLMMSQT
jgi:hypothetical protein